MGVETGNSAGGAPQRPRRGKRWLAVLAGINLVAVGLVAAPSQAQTVTCTSTLSDQTISATLVVPAGAACELINVDVDGRAEVNDFSDLFLTNSRIRGPLTVGNSSYTEATDSRVDGMTTLSGSFGLNSERSRFSRVVDSTDAQVLISTDSTHWGGVRVRGSGTEVALSGGVVIGSVSSTGSVYTDVYDTAVFGPIMVANAQYGSVLCHMGAALSVTVQTSGGGQVHIGDESFFSNCGFNLLGSLRVDNNSGADILISSNVVGGNLDCSGNDPAPHGGNNLVGGSRTGQCASLTPAPAGTQMTIQEETLAPRDEHIRALIAQRTGS